jgi:hypothetical protein
MRGQADLLGRSRLLLTETQQRQLGLLAPLSGSEANLAGLAALYADWTAGLSVTAAGGPLAAMDLAIAVPADRGVQFAAHMLTPVGSVGFTTWGLRLGGASAIGNGWTTYSMVIAAPVVAARLGYSQNVEPWVGYWTLSPQLPAGSGYRLLRGLYYSEADTTLIGQVQIIVSAGVIASVGIENLDSFGNRIANGSLLRANVSTLAGYGL